MQQARARILALAVPAQESSHCAAVAKIVQMRGSDAGPQGEIELREDRMKGLTDGARVDWTLATEREHWSIGRQRILTWEAAFEIFGEQCTDVGTERDEATLSELRVAHDEKPPLPIDVLALKATRFADAQPESVEHREHRSIGRPA